MRKSLLIALLLAGGASAWILSGQFGSDTRPASAVSETARNAPAEPPLPAVRISEIEPAERPHAIVVNGHTEASRTVTLRAEVHGAIVKVGAEEGTPVSEGGTIAEIAMRDRKARLDEANALLRQRRLEYEAAKELSKKGFRSSTSVAQAQALLDAAKAQLRLIEVELSQTVIAAPFDGVLQTRDVEIGTYVKEGDSIATVVDLDPAVIVAYVSERDIAQVTVGQRGKARLVGGATVEGTVRYVSAVADEATRSFKVELKVPNPDGLVRQGLTAELVLPLAPIRAYRVSPAVLTLDAKGIVGVKLVDDSDTVRFVPVNILADVGDGVWVAGLPPGPRLITVGHEFVKEGQRVRPVPETAGARS